MNRIIRISTVLSAVFKGLFFIALISPIIIWAFAPQSLDFLSSIGADYVYSLNTLISSHQLTVSQKLLAFGISLIPTSITLLILYKAFRLCDLYKKMIIYSERNAILLRSIAALLLLRQLVDPIYQALISVTLTWHNPPGKGVIAISLSNINIGMVILSFFILLIALIMHEGAKLQQDSASII